MTRVPDADHTDQADAIDDLPGAGIVRASTVTTAAFVVAAVGATAFPDALGVPVAVFDVVLFAVGTVIFVVAMLQGLDRSRTEQVEIGALFFLTGDTASAFPHLLDGARTWCDRLVVGIADADPTAEAFAELGAVDLVARYGADTVLDLIRLLRPDVLVQDPAGAPETVAGGEMLQEWGGTVRKPEPVPVG